ncbi:hypothetical protein FKW77_004143 [Venturia effusa]|uniref:Chitin-binding type-1 domain-containing protein n=1 Tax=Venturia effusa TaxID=50376 RepID=A0A517L938_9PEZI|nr:hypothetical protein FKW77_004143 [Venturia effusa]
MRNAFVASVLLAGAAPALAKDLYTSPDGSCGPDTAFTCKQSFYGGCCGPDNKCGSTADVCGTGCQKDYGYCQPATTHDKRWNLGMPKFVLPVKPARSSSSSYKASASIYPSKSMNGTKGFSHGKPTAPAGYDYASTVTITSVASATKAPSSPWWWPFGGSGFKSNHPASSSPTRGKGGANGGAQGGSQAKPVVYSKFTTLTVTSTKTHTYNYKGSKSLSYETYAAPT